MSFISLVSLGGLFIIMVPNLQAKYSISFAISTGLRMWRQLLITLLLMVWQKHSTRQLSSYSRNSFHQANEIGMRSLENVFGPTELWSECQQVIRFFLWYTGVRQSYR